MNVILLVSTLTFLFYYLSCIYSGHREKLAFGCFFVLTSFVLRWALNPNLSADYELYFNFRIFSEPTDILSFFVKEPYLYLMYSFFSFFSNDKIIVFSCLYWFNYLIVTSFFVWLLYRKDVQMWKKIVLFSCYYILFAFVLLRNAPVYIIFGLFFYYSFRTTSKNFYFIFLTPFIHISSVLMLSTFFYKKKKYLMFLMIFLIIAFLATFIILTFFKNTSAFHILIYKLNFYSNGIKTIGIMHKLFFTYIVLLFITNVCFYGKQMLHPVLITPFVIYFISFFINPVVAFRLSPYVLLGLFFYDYKGLKNIRIVKLMNLYSIVLLPFFIFALWFTHNMKNIGF